MTPKYKKFHIENQFWNLEFQGVFPGLGIFRVILSIEILNCRVKKQNCRAKEKLPWKSPDSVEYPVYTLVPC